MRSAAPAGPVPPFAVQLTDGGNIVVRSVTPLWRTNISRPGRGPAARGSGRNAPPISQTGARLRSTSCLSSRHAHQLPLDPPPRAGPPVARARRGRGRRALFAGDDLRVG